MYIPYGKQEITDSDIESVIETLKSDFLTQGPQVPKFEDQIKNYCGSNYAIAYNSATSALHAACYALGLTKGDILWTSPISFVASANCGLYCGADVDFVDIDPITFNICPNKLKDKLIAAKKINKLPKIIIPVHLGGSSCDMFKIAKLAEQYGIKIIEDASHAIGGSYKNTKIGKCEFSDITVFSFHPVKIITSGEGGIATTNCEEVSIKLQSFRTHGIVKDPNLMTKVPDGPWYYEQIDLGFNYRLTDIQAALGISQLARLDSYVAKRNHLAKKYDDFFKNISFVNVQSIPEENLSSYHLYIIRIDEKEAKKEHKHIFTELRNMNVGVNIHYIPIHLQPYYAQLGFNNGDFIESENYYSQAISLPIYPTMTKENQETVMKNFLKIFN